MLKRKNAKQYHEYIEQNKYLQKGEYIVNVVGQSLIKLIQRLNKKVVKITIITIIKGYTRRKDV